MAYRLRTSDWASYRWYTVTPAIALMLFVAVMSAFFAYLHRSEAEQQRQTLYRDVEWAQQTLRLRLRTNQETVSASAEEWAGSANGDGDRLRPAVRDFLGANPDAVYVALVDNGRRLAWVLPASGVEVPAARASGGTLEDAAGLWAFDEARLARQTVYGPPFLGEGGDVRMEMHVPVVKDNAFLGTIVVAYSLPRMLVAGLPAEVRDRGQVTLLDHGGNPLAESGSRINGDGSRRPDDEPLPTAELALEPPGHGIRLRIASRGMRPLLLDRMLQTLVIGLSVAIVVSLLLLWRHAKRRSEAEAERDRLFELSLDVLCIMRGDGRFLRCNPAFSELFEQRAPVRELLQIVHPEDRSAVQRALSGLNAGGAAARSSFFEARCAEPGSRDWRWLEWSIRSAPVLRGGRRASTMYAVAHDVTDRKAAENALAAETLFRRAVEDSLLTGLRVFDMDGRITYVNPAFCRMVGFEEEELLGKDAPFPYWADDEHPQQYANLDAVLRGDAPPAGYTVRVRRKDGALLDTRMYVSPLVDTDGRQTGWLTSMTDITEPTRIRRELEAAHERFATVLDELDVAVSVMGTDEDGAPALLFANRMHRSLFDGHGDGHRELSTAAASLADPAGGAAAAPVAEIYVSCVQRWFDVRTRDIRWVDGRPVQLLVAADVSARRAAQDAQRQQDERLARTSRLVTMGEMASSLAHELNQPLTAIANYTMGIAARVRARKSRGEAVDHDEMIEMLTKTARQAERAGQVLRRIRDFVKRSEPARANCTVDTIVADAVGLAEIDARRSRVPIEVSIDAGMPRLFADPILIEQVLLNLVKNGIESTREAAREAGDRMPRRPLRVGVRARGDEVEFRVQDAGTGLAEGAREKLFEPFFTTKAEGMGMGLNICRSIVESHQGRLWVEENPDGGCTFAFTLPLAGGAERRAA